MTTEEPKSINPLKNVPLLVGICTLVGVVITAVGDRVLADNQVKVNTADIVDLKKTDENFTHYMQLVQRQITVQETKMDRVQDDVKELGEKMDRNAERNEKMYMRMLDEIRKK